MKKITFRFVNFFIIGLVLLTAATPPTPAQAWPILAIPQSAGEVIGPNAAMGALYNTNLVPDGDAENTNYSTYWTDNEKFTQILSYGANCGGMCNFPSPYDVGPTQRGTHFFYMGGTDNHTNGTNMWITTRISLAPIQAAVNTGKVRYILSGYFGGDTTQADTAQLHMFFETDAHANKGEDTVGNVTPAERQYKTGLLYRQKTGTIPAGTQDINLDLQSGQMSGSYWRTGYADNLSLILLPFQTYVPVAMKATANQPPPQTGYPAPSGVFAAPDGLTGMDIYWTDNSSDELGFEVQRINADSSVDTVCNTKPNVTYCVDPGIKSSGYVYLGSHKSYTYQVRAVGAGINSAWASYTALTATMPTSAPVLKSGLTFTCQAIEVTSSAATFVWNDPFNYEAGFNIYVGNNAYPSWSMLEGGTKISFINQNPGSITLKIKPFVYDPTNPTIVYESSTSCSATANLPAPASSGVTYFQNSSSYPVISLVVDGWEQFPVRPLGIMNGGYYELDGVPSGQHSWTAITGFWDDWGQRFSMYVYSGSYTQPGSGSQTVQIADMSIQDLLSVPPANLGYWEGYYFDAGGNCFTTAFKFQQNGAYTFYNANSAIDSGIYSLVQREPDIFSTKFHVTSSTNRQNVDGLLVETHGQFFMKNGPPSWLQITYVYKPQGYVRNPYCP